MRIKNDKNITYKDYENKTENKKKLSTMTFLSVFAVLLIIFLGFAKLVSPDVDISLGDDSTSSSYDSDMDDSYHGGVDSRLKKLKDEDDGNLGNPDAEVEEDGLVKIPQKHDEEVAEKSPKEPVATQPETPEKQVQAEAPAPQTASPAPTPQPAVTYRVLVGMYSTQAQAEVAKGILQDAGLGVTPRIRQINSGYTLQVGAFSSKESATNLSNKLLMNNYPARVVSE